MMYAKGIGRAARHCAGGRVVSQGGGAGLRDRACSTWASPTRTARAWQRTRAGLHALRDRGARRQQGLRRPSRRHRQDADARAAARSAIARASLGAWKADADAGWQRRQPLRRRRSQLRADPTNAPPPARMEGERFAATPLRGVASMAMRTAWRSGSTRTRSRRTRCEAFRTSSYADGAKGGKPRTHGRSSCSARAAAPPMPRRRRCEVDRPQHEPRELAAGRRAVGGRNAEGLPGREDERRREAGRRAESAASSARAARPRGRFDFDVTLPAKEAAAGMTCGK